VSVAHGLDEARVVARRCAPDVVVLDYDVGGEPGTRLIADLHGLSVRPQVVMLSASSDTDAIIDALECGASALVVKGTRVEVLMAAIDEVLAGRTYLYPTTVRSVIARLLHAREPEPTFVDDLSERQLEVLRCLVSGLDRAEVAQRLFISANTVRTHVQNLLATSGLHSTLALVARARELGVRGVDDPTGEASGSSR
ncbi:MAG: response regulator transcription factor, partial [Nocardioidaceae bacterium]